MSLADLANSTLEGFDPKKDSINSGSNGLPVGEYTTTVESINHQVYDSGYDCVRVVFQVIEGDHVGEKEYYNISFAETYTDKQTRKVKAIPDFILSRNIKFIAKLGNLLGVDVPATVYADNETDTHENINQLLHGKAGAIVKLTVNERPNKKDPSSPYKEYELNEVEEKIDVPNIEDDSGFPFN